MDRISQALKRIEAGTGLPDALCDVAMAEPVEPAPSFSTAGPLDADALLAATLQRVEMAEAMTAEAMADGVTVSEIGAQSTLVGEEAREAFRPLAENILPELPTDRGTALLFTSPSDREGKTTTVLSLADALLEQIRDKVLLVDANLRNPELAARLGVETVCGLAHVLTGVANWQQVVRHTSLPRLDLLPGTGYSPFGARLPWRLDLKPLLEQLCQEYRAVLIDGPSLAYREVAPMAAQCSGAYLIVRLDHSTRRQVDQSIRVIEVCGGRLLGGVVLEG